MGIATRIARGLLFALFVSGFAANASAESRLDAVLKRVKLPPGFKISVFAEVPKPRSMVVGTPLGTVFVGSRHGTLYALRDTNRDGVADEVVKLAGKLDVPNGVAYQDGVLYIAENKKVFFWGGPAEFDLKRPFAPLISIYKSLPPEFLHGWRYAAFGPDKKLYVSVGAPCNICKVKGIEGTIIRMDPNGKNVEIYARGVRNSVGFDWHPKTKQMFFTDNGADGMGDNVPPDELNMVTAKGQHFGFPHLGGKVKLPGMAPAPAGVVAPVLEFQAHTANLGIHFYTGKMFPRAYRNDAFVAQHGSWNRTEPVGYRIMRIRFNAAGKVIGKQVFASGWLQGGNASGRPVDIKTLPDGSLIVSDDYANAIYRISYSAR
jgi:glucose/arabinose dehydrogenase